MKKLLSALSIFLIVLLLSTSVSALENLAYKIVEATASTYFNEDYHPSKVYDGIVREHDMRLPSWIADFDVEATLTLTWSAPVKIAKAVLYDLANTQENVEKGTMTFSDGTKVTFGALNADGSATEIALPGEITANSVVIAVTASDTTMSVGLDEVELYDASGKNVALDAKAEASSVQPDGTPYWFIPAKYTDWHAASNAINGVATATLPAGAENEYASQGEPLPWITLKWAAPVRIGTIILRDRVGDADWIKGGTITFADGTSVEFGELDNNGARLYVDVPDVSTDTIKIEATVSDGPNPGFSEVEVYTEHFNADGTPIITETAASAPAADEGQPEAPVTVTAPATFDPTLTLAALLSVSVGLAAVISKKRVKK